MNLTPRKSERLQSYDDDYTRWGRNAKGEVYELADTPRYRMIGNGVTTELARQIAERVPN